MNKLFKAGLAVFAIALLATSASAFSPAWDTIPDVLVGGCEGGGIVFTDAINAFNYVSDQDNATTSLGIYFAEGAWNTLATRAAQQVDGSSTNDLSINGKAEVDYTGTGDTKLNDQSLLNAGLALTSPSNGNLSFATSDGADRVAVLIASDGFTSPSVSKAFRVRGSLADCDEASLPVVVVNVDGWDLQNEFNSDWAFAAFNISGGTATSGQAGDALSITSPLVGQNVAFWQLSATATKIPVTAAQTGVLRARYTLTGGAATPAQWPGIFMRIFEQQNRAVADLTVSANAYVPAASTSRTYQAFYTAPAAVGSELNVAMFCVDTSDGNGGTFSLQQLVIDSVVGLDALFSQVAAVDAAESLTFNNVIDIDIVPTITAAQTADAFTFTGATISSTQLGFEIGQINNLVASMGSNTLYRMVNTVTSTTPQANQPGFQFRLFDAANAIIATALVKGTGAGSSHMPTTTPGNYMVYLSSEGVNGTELRGSFDMIHNDPALAGSITWDRAVIEAVDLGIIP